MSKVVSVTAYCDGLLAPHGQAKEAIAEVTLALGKNKPRLIDVCRSCHKTYEDLVAHLKDVGVVVAPVQPTSRAVGQANQPSKPSEPGFKSCPMCDWTGDVKSRSGHVLAQHGKGVREFKREGVEFD